MAEDSIGTLIKSEKVRAWAYRVVLALIPILVAIGAVSEELAPLIVSLVAAFLGVGLATVNTTTKDG